MKLKKFVTYSATIGGLECVAGIGEDGQYVVLGEKLFTSIEAARECLTKGIASRDRLPGNRLPARPWRLIARLEWLDAVVADLEKIMEKS